MRLTTDWPDKINGLYEILGSLFILMHCIKLYGDKKVRGIYVPATVFFFTWGVWNLYYYPSLGQWMSFTGGVAIVIMNALWIGMMLYYNSKEKQL